MDMEQKRLDLKKRSHQIIGIIICVGITILGAALGYGTVLRPASKIAEAQNWVKTSCTIESMDFKTTHHNKRTSSRMIVRYTYEYDGRKYWSSNYRYSKGKYTKGMIFQPGQKTYCFVNPDNPAEAVMIRDDSAWSLWSLLPISFIVIGIIGVLNTIRYMIYYTTS